MVYKYYYISTRDYGRGDEVWYVRRNDYPGEHSWGGVFDRVFAQCTSEQAAMAALRLLSLD